jgi:TPR repeat protein
MPSFFHFGGGDEPNSFAEATNSAQVSPAVSETIRGGVPAIATMALLARGDGYLQSGDITSARLFYEYAADAGEANGALRLAETFDPVFLERARLAGSSANMQQALFWYRRARYLGSSEAGILLEQLEAKQ